jgi:hypothetical protein
MLWCGDDDGADANALHAAAAQIGLTLPEACIDGVLANVALLKSHAALVEAFAPQAEGDDA